MARIQRKENVSHITQYYNISGIFNLKKAVEWICSILNKKEIVSDVISLNDLINRSDEGSGDVQLENNTTIDDIMGELSDKNIDLITINGSFHNKPIVLGVDLRNFHVFVTARKNNMVDLSSLEQYLKLVDNIDYRRRSGKTITPVTIHSPAAYARNSYTTAFTKKHRRRNSRIGEYITVRNPNTSFTNPLTKDDFSHKIKKAIRNKGVSFIEGGRKSNKSLRGAMKRIHKNKKW